MTPEITATLKRHPLWYGPRPDWVFTFEKGPQAYRYRGRGNTLYEIFFDGNDGRAIWIVRSIGPPVFCLDVTTKIFAKSLHLSDGSKFVFPPQKVSGKVYK